MVHGILQFTPSIAFRYVLHRCESRDIRCRESFSTHLEGSDAVQYPRTGGTAHASSFRFLGADRAGGELFAGRPGQGPGTQHRVAEAASSPHAPRFVNEFAGRSAVQGSTMILPQVHLRKPCYDFSFL